MPLTKDEIRSLLSDIENERVERTLATFKVVVQNADIIENGTNVIEKTPNGIVNVTGSGTDDTPMMSPIARPLSPIMSPIAKRLSLMLSPMMVISEKKL